MKKVWKKLFLGTIALTAVSASVIAVSSITLNWQKFFENNKYRNLKDNKNENFISFFKNNFENLDFSEDKSIISFDTKQEFNYLSSIDKEGVSISINFDDNSYKANITTKNKKTKRIIEEQEVEIKFHNDGDEIEIIKDGISYKKSELLKEMNQIKQNTVAITASMGGALIALGAAIIGGVAATAIISSLQMPRYNRYPEKIPEIREKVKPESSVAVPVDPIFRPEEEEKNRISIREEFSEKKIKVSLEKIAVASEVAKRYEKLNEDDYYLTFFLLGETFLSTIPLSPEEAQSIVVNSGETEWKNTKKEWKSTLIEGPNWRQFIEGIVDNRFKFAEVYTFDFLKAYKLATDSAETLNTTNVSVAQWKPAKPEKHKKFIDREFPHFHVEKKFSKQHKIKKNAHILFLLPYYDLHN